jgi:hypothetical protein
MGHETGGFKVKCGGAMQAFALGLPIALPNSWTGAEFSSIFHQIAHPLFGAMAQ